MAKISVIIPVYNVENYLRECLDSVINQSLNDIEIICVNDGSTDNSANILNEYAQKDNRIRIITQENSGLAPARNKGLEYANGEYIFFLDSDDYICADILEQLYKTALETNSDFIMSKSKAYPDDNDNNNINFADELNDGFLKFKPIKNCKITKEIFSKIIEEYPCIAWGNLYKKSFLEKNNLKFIDKNVIHEDNGFFLKVCSCLPNFTAIEELGVMYRIRPKSVMTSTQKNLQKRKTNMILALNDTYKFIKETNSENYKFFIEKIKNTSTYSIYYGYECIIPYLFKFIWSKNNKRIKILFFPIFREKIKNGKYIIKIFGIPVWIKKIQGDV